MRFFARHKNHTLVHPETAFMELHIAASAFICVSCLSEAVHCGVYDATVAQ